MPVDSSVLLAALQALMPQQALLLARYLLKWLAFHEGGSLWGSSHDRITDMENVLQV